MVTFHNVRLELVASVMDSGSWLRHKLPRQRAWKPSRAGAATMRDEEWSSLSPHFVAMPAFKQTPPENLEISQARLFLFLSGPWQCMAFLAAICRKSVSRMQVVCCAAIATDFLYLEFRGCARIITLAGPRTRPRTAYGAVYATHSCARSTTLRLAIMWHDPLSYHRG